MTQGDYRAAETPPPTLFHVMICGHRRGKGYVGFFWIRATDAEAAKNQAKENFRHEGYEPTEPMSAICEDDFTRERARAT